VTGAGVLYVLLCVLVLIVILALLGVV